MFLLKYHFWHFQPYIGKGRGVAKWNLAHVTSESNCAYIPSFRPVAPRFFLDKILYLVFPHYHGNHFPDFFSPCFKLDQNLSSYQVSEKSTHRLGQNDGTNIKTDRHLLLCI